MFGFHFEYYLKCKHPIISEHKEEETVVRYTLERDCADQQVLCVR